jgi:anti-sigma B factor antagonist
MSPRGSLPKVEQSGNVKIITLSGGRIRHDNENPIANELEGHTGELEKRHLLLDFTHVKSICSLELGTLLTLHKRLKASGGRLTLFNLNAQIFEVFTVTRLQTVLGICREQATAAPL